MAMSMVMGLTLLVYALAERHLWRLLLCRVSPFPTRPATHSDAHHAPGDLNWWLFEITLDEGADLSFIRLDD